MRSVTARERAIREELEVGPREALEGILIELRQHEAWVNALAGVDWTSVQPVLDEMSEAAAEVAIAAEGIEAMARAQGEARAFRYLANLPSMLKQRLEELQARAAQERRTLEMLQTDAGYTGAGAADLERARR